MLVVDEAVYALQEMQPGLEKVYFTLQEELLKPQAQVLYKPSETIDTLVRQPALTDGQQQIAEVLLTAVKPKPPARWEVNPVVERRQKMQGQVAADRLGRLQLRPDQAGPRAGQGRENVVVQAGPAQGAGGSEAARPVAC